jgi:hypothetical protein
LVIAGRQVRRQKKAICVALLRSRRLTSGLEHWCKFHFAIDNRYPQVVAPDLGLSFSEVLRSRTYSPDLAETASASMMALQDLHTGAALGKMPAGDLEDMSLIYPSRPSK